MTALKIPSGVFQQIASHGERTYPEECCGVMLGEQSEEGRTVRETIEIDNSQDANRRRRFLITPEQYRMAERQAAARNLDLLGFYHSHPDHPAEPSAFDTEHALPWFSYVIVSVVKGKANRATSWILEENRTRFAGQQLIQGGVVERVSNAK
jgi:proteasome lid subunit RPN8/RPN11